MTDNAKVRFVATTAALTIAALAGLPLVLSLAGSLGLGMAASPAPRAVALRPYVMLVESATVTRSLVVSTGVTVGGTAFSLVVTTLAAFALGRPVPGRGVIRGLLFVPLIVNAGLVPLYVTVRGLGFVDSPLALVLPFSLNLVLLHILTRYFAAAELAAIQEAAELDGASAWRTLLVVVVPATLPAVAAVGLLYGISYWNAWFPAFLFINRPQLYPLQLVLRELTVSSAAPFGTGLLAGGRHAGEAFKMAAVVLTALPALPIVYLVQRRIRAVGLLAGLQ